MSKIPQKLRYSESHEWVRAEGDDIYTVGMTDHAQCLLGEVVYLELPESGTEVEATLDVGLVESIKAASDIYSPITGEIVETNETLIEEPHFINQDPYGLGWLFRVQALHDNPCDKLLDAKAYAKHIASEAH